MIFTLPSRWWSRRVI